MAAYLPWHTTGQGCGWDGEPQETKGKGQVTKEPMPEEEVCRLADDVLSTPRAQQWAHKYTWTLNRALTIEALKMCKCRATTQPYYAWEILYEGRWRRLYRTDAWDDIGTGQLDYSPTKAINKKGGPIGARVSADSFGVIDSLTDG